MQLAVGGVKGVICKVLFVCRIVLVYSVLELSTTDRTGISTAVVRAKV